jgi:hypothetical protein
MSGLWYIRRVNIINGLTSNIWPQTVIVLLEQVVQEKSDILGCLIGVFDLTLRLLVSLIHFQSGTSLTGFIDPIRVLLAIGRNSGPVKKKIAAMSLIVRFYRVVTNWMRKVSCCTYPDSFCCKMRPKKTRTTKK